MSSTQSIFLLGATGYIGGSLLVTLLKEYSSATINALVRSSQTAEVVKSVAPDRVNIVLGSHSDTSIIEAEVEKADVTVNAANFVLAEDAKGPFLGKLDARGNKIWDDTKSEDLRAIPLSAMHRPVDIAFLEAHDSGILDAYIVCPGFVYGVGIGPVKTISIQIPLLLQRAFAIARSGAKVDAYRNYYFAASSENSIKEITELIAAVLHGKGLVDSPHARSLSAEDPDEKLLSMMIGHTSRAVSVRAKSLGWSPSEKKINESGVMEAEVDNILKTTQAAS